MLTPFCGSPDSDESGLAGKEETRDDHTSIGSLSFETSRHSVTFVQVQARSEGGQVPIADLDSCSLDHSVLVKRARRFTHSPCLGKVSVDHHQ